MRVVLLSTNMAQGGAEKQVAQIAAGLRRLGHDTAVVSLIKPTAFEKDLAAAGIPLYAPGLTRIPGLLRRLRPQVLHCHMFHANIAGRLLRLVLPFPAVISTIHSTAESRRATGAIRHRDCLYRLTDRLADATVAVSHAAADRHVRAKAVRHARVIPNGVDTEVFRPDPAKRAAVRGALGLGSEFCWLAVGRLMWKKNFAGLMEAFANTPSATLLIAGTGPEEEQLRKAAGPRVKLLGHYADIAALMNAADGFVLSSVVEGLPLVLLEAAATALPCVATDVGGVAETSVAITASAAGDLAGAMTRVMQMTADEREAMGAAARRRVEAAYSLDAVVRQWDALYREVAAWT